jgi:hypothetical protein
LSLFHFSDNDKKHSKIHLALIILLAILAPQ